MYTGLPRGVIAPGKHAGIVGAVLREHTAARYVNELERDRKHADYEHIRFDVAAMRIDAEGPFTGREERRMKKRAEIAFIAALSKIADLSGLTEGDDEFDFFIEIPRDQGLHEFSQRLTDVEMEVRDRFGVRVSALPVGGAHLTDHAPTA